MRSKRGRRLGAMVCSAASLSCAVVLPLSAQTDRPWVDPPARLEAPPEPPSSTPRADTTHAPEEAPQSAVQPPAAQPEQHVLPVPAPIPPAARETAPQRPTRPPNDDLNQGKVRSGRLPSPPEITLGLRAEQLALDYLDFWSAPNAVTLARMPAFYGREVMFHGRRMSLEALMNDKRRFARRWPNRRYQPRPETMRIACDAAAEICNLRTVVNFVTASPERGKRSRGAITLALDISFADGLPVIVTENSRVIARSAASRGVPDE